MGITESYINILEDSLKRKIEILDAIESLNVQQKTIIDAETFDEEAFGRIVEQKATFIDKLNGMDQGFQLLYDNVKGELDRDRVRYEQEIKHIKEMITQIIEKSNHIMVEEHRNKEKIKGRFAMRRKEISSVKKNQQYAANYYRNMNKMTSEPVFMDKKK